MSKLLDSKMLVDSETVYNLKESTWLGLPSKCNDWWFGVQNSSATKQEREVAAKYIANAINTHEGLAKQVAELRAALESIHSSVFDIQDGCSISNSDGEIVDIVNKALEGFQL